MKKLLTIFLFLITYALSFAPAHAATDLQVTCNDSSCSVSPISTPLFDESNIYPLQNFSSQIKAINTGSNAMDFKVSIKDLVDDAPALNSLISIAVTEIESGNIIYGPKTVEQWIFDNSITLTDIPAGAQKNYLFNATLADVGNDYQNKQLSFDLHLNFNGIPSESGEGGGGSVLPATTSSNDPKTCDDASPTSAPSLTAFQGSTNSIILNWTSVSPATHYMIRYGTLAGNYIYGASNVGNVNSFVVSQLSSGTTYYFQVAGVNGCMPGPWSNEVSISPFGVILPEAPAPEFEVLGTQDEEKITPTPVNEGQVSGATACAEQSYPWWLPLVIQALLTLIYFVFIGKKRHRRYFWIIPITLAILSQIIHAYLGCNCATGNLCPYYWLFNLAIVTILTSTYLINRRKKEK